MDRTSKILQNTNTVLVRSNSEYHLIFYKAHQGRKMLRTLYNHYLIDWYSIIMKVFWILIDYLFELRFSNVACMCELSLYCIEIDILLTSYFCTDVNDLFSAEGTLNCVYYVATENSTYVTVYNSDSSVPDELTTFRFSCYVSKFNFLFAFYIAKPVFAYYPTFVLDWT